MGVIHKLKPKIIDFIVSSKQNDKNLSCRQIAAMITEKYQIKVSKSSVNTLLKTSNMSSTVGRRPSATGVKKFEIPQYRKKQFQESMKRLEKDSNAFLKTKKEKTIKQGKEGKEEIEGLLSPKVEHKIKPVKSKAEPSDVKENELTEQIALLRKKEAGIKRTLLDGMGFVFLKVVEWEISEQPIIANLLIKYFKEQLPEKFEKIFEVLILSSLLGPDGVKKLDENINQGLWKLHGVEKQSLRELEAWLKSVELPKYFLSEYYSEVEQYFMLANSIKVVMSDDSEIILDPYVSSIFSMKPPLSFLCPINAAMSTLSSFLMSNNKVPTIFCASQNDEDFEKMLSLISVLENISAKTIDKISLFDKNNNEITSFYTVPCKRRQFILKVPNISDGLKMLCKALKIEEGALLKNEHAKKNVYYFEELDKIYYYSEVNNKYLNVIIDETMISLKGIFIREEESRSPGYLLLSNLTDKSAKEIISLSLTKHPILKDTFQEKNFNKNVISQEENAAPAETLSDVVDDYLNRLCRLFKIMYLYDNQHIDVKAFIRVICSIPGAVELVGQNTIIHLSILSSHPFIKELVVICNRVNNKYIINNNINNIKLNILSNH